MSVKGVRTWLVVVAVGVILGVVAGALFPHRATAAKQRIAILGVEPIDSDKTTQGRTARFAKLLTEGMRNQVTTGATSYDMALNSQRDLTEVKLVSDCLDESVGCLASIGRDLRADILVFGHIEKKKGEYLITVTSLVVASKSPGPLNLSRGIPVEDGTDDLMRTVGSELFGPGGGPAGPGNPPPPLPAPPSATLIVQTNVTTGTVFVNGEAKTTITNGSATVKGLPEGPVEVAIESPGFVRVAGKTMLHADQPTHYQVDLQPEAPKPPASNVASVPLIPKPDENKDKEKEAHPNKTARVLFWTSLIATAGGVAAFTVTGLQVKSIEDEETTAIKAWGTHYADNGIQFPNDACAEAKNDGYAPITDICDRGRRMSTITNVLIGATTVTALASAYFLWKGYLSTPDPQKDEPASASGRRPHVVEPTVVIGPEIYSNGGGFGAVIQF
jgi:hypothetical protein